MSLPRELLDELLSAYMDGELSADERARVEQMLAADPEVRQSLRLLQKQSQAIRDSLRAAPSLGPAFADRVLAATFAEAQRQSLDASHPVQRAALEAPRHGNAAERPHLVRRSATSGGVGEPDPSRKAASGGGFGRRHFVAGLAIAASLALAAVFYLRQSDDRPVARVDPPGANQPERPGLESAGEATISSAPDAAPRPQTVVSETPSPQTATPPDSVTAEGAPRMAARGSATEAPATETPATETPATGPPASEVAIPGDRVPLRAVLVYEVNLTPLGREQNVINRAFREAQIRAADQREIDESLVSYLRSGGMIGGVEEGESAGEGGPVSVLFLEGSGKRLEKLMLTLLSATEEVDSVGFSLAMDPPVMAAIDSLREVDPTQIRGDAASVVAQALAPAGGAESVGGFTAGSRSFAPLNRDALQAMGGFGGVTSGDEPDITAMTFLIIR